MSTSFPFASVGAGRAPFRAAAKSDDVLELCRAGIEANLRTPIRQGNQLVLTPDAGDDVLVSADLHGHVENFRRILEAADLERRPRRHLVLQEVCHGGPTYPGRACRSHAMLEEVVRLKATYPDRVHFLLSNHELSEQTMHPIAKDGRILLVAFRMGLAAAYGDAGEEVHQALVQFIASCPLALRVGDAFICHSAPERMEEFDFDPSVLDRPLEPHDLLPGGSVFRMVWGRDYREENARRFAERVGAGVLIHGHTPCAAGYDVPNAHQLILDCSADAAAYALLPVRGRHTLESVQQGVQLFGSATPAQPQADAPADSPPPAAPVLSLADSTTTNSTTTRSTTAFADKATHGTCTSTTDVDAALQRCMQLEGATAAGLVDYPSGMCLGADARQEIDVEAVAAGAAEVVRRMRRALPAASSTEAVEDLVISTCGRYQLIRVVDRNPDLLLFIILERERANLAIARRKLAEAAEALER